VKKANYPSPPKKKEGRRFFLRVRLWKRRSFPSPKKEKTAAGFSPSSLTKATSGKFRLPFSFPRLFPDGGPPLSQPPPFIVDDVFFLPSSFDESEVVVKAAVLFLCSVFFEKMISTSPFFLPPPRHQRDDQPLFRASLPESRRQERDDPSSPRPRNSSPPSFISGRFPFDMDKLDLAAAILSNSELSMRR